MSLKKSGKLERWAVFLIFLNAEDGDKVNDNSREDGFIGGEGTLSWGISSQIGWKMKG